MKEQILGFFVSVLFCILTMSYRARLALGKSACRQNETLTSVARLGHCIWIVAKKGRVVFQLIRMCIKFIFIPMSNIGTNFLLMLVACYISYFKQNSLLIGADS